MSLTRQITIWCDGCSAWEQASSTTAPRLRAQLKRKGWQRRSGKDFCPACIESGQSLRCQVFGEGGAQCLRPLGHTGLCSFRADTVAVWEPREGEPCD